MYIYVYISMYEHICTYIYINIYMYTSLSPLYLYICMHIHANTHAMSCTHKNAQQNSMPTEITYLKVHIPIIFLCVLCLCA